MESKDRPQRDDIDDDLVHRVKRPYIDSGAEVSALCGAVDKWTYNIREEAAGPCGNVCLKCEEIYQQKIKVLAYKSEEGWELRIDDSPVSYSPTLDEATGKVYDYLMESRPETHPMRWDIEVDWRFDDPKLTVEVFKARAAKLAAVMQLRVSALALRNAGVSDQDLLSLLGVSKQQLSDSGISLTSSRP